MNTSRIQARRYKNALPIRKNISALFHHRNRVQRIHLVKKVRNKQKFEFHFNSFRLLGRVEFFTFKNSSDRCSFLSRLTSRNVTFSPSSLITIRTVRQCGLMSFWYMVTSGHSCNNNSSFTHPDTSVYFQEKIISLHRFYIK